ncbi:GGDEF domain-containing protein [Geothermobacter hydrogeniphilus]|uniref:diguanylate cyclase n=2 Tax=Geothermobacter hydrogeniphilus TaxID=1969733 RepID=A0A2K2H8C9_9BACT|nr:GGDEF domain-containing protein [Geothermobacter hydrogeniphilus]
MIFAKLGCITSCLRRYGAGLKVIFSGAVMETSSSVNTMQRQPSRLLQLMVIVAMISISVILILVGSGIYQVFERQLVQIAEKDAIQAGNDLLHREAASLLRTGPQGQVDLAVDMDRLAEFDQRLRQTLKPFNIVKVTIFSPEWVVLYSSDRSLIGTNEFGNDRLNRALKGTPDSQLVQHEKISRPGEPRPSIVDVVESYIPIRVGNGQVIGCFEIYRDVTRYRQDLLSGVIASVLLLLLVLLGVFGLSYLFLRQAAKRLQAAQDEIRRATILDELTGVANRREILQRAGIEISRMQRLEEQALENCLALLVIDVDHLNLINQEYGRAAGDDVLRGLSQRLAGELRGYDALGRYGGEEFLVVLPASTRSGALAAAERFCQKVRSAPFIVDTLEIEVTVSIGLAIAKVHEPSFEPALKRALEALARAKQQGCNCVVGAEAIEPPDHPARIMSA